MRKHAIIETLIAFRVFGRYTRLVLAHLIRTTIEKKTLDPYTGIKHAFYRRVVIGEVSDELDLQLAVMSAYTKMLQRTN